MTWENGILTARPAVLFITGTRIGDAVLTTGILDALTRRWPGLRLTVVAGVPAAPLFQAVPGLERLIVLSKKKHAAHWLDLYREVGGQRWDLAVDLRGSAFTFLLRARRRLVTSKGPPQDHRVVHLGRLLGLVPPPAPRLWTLPRHDQAAAAMIPGPGPTLAVAPAANWPAKQWRAERFADVIRRLTAPGAPLARATVAVFAADHERGVAQTVLETVPPSRRIAVIGEPDLLTVAATLRQAALFIGNDSGLMHMSAAVGAPTLGLFGPSPVEQYAPWGEHGAVARTALSREALVGAPDFDPRRPDTLMDSLSVEAVEAAALALLRRCPQPRI